MPNVPLFVGVWKALGAQPTPMAFSEVFTSLQNGTIEAQENPLALIKSASFAEVQDYVNLTDHVRSWIYLTISELTWGKLSDEDQAAVLEAARRAQDYERELFLAEEEQLVAGPRRPPAWSSSRSTRPPSPPRPRTPCSPTSTTRSGPMVEKLFAD